jgi:hypothetical protein
MSFRRLPDALEPVLSIVVLVLVYVSSGFNRYMGVLLSGLLIVGVYMRVTKRGDVGDLAQNNLAMIYLNGLFGGIAGALVASGIWIVVRLVFPLTARFVVESEPGWTASGTLAVALMGFVVGFYWGIRKAKRVSRSIFR